MYIRTKLAYLHTNVVLMTYDVFIFTETWLTKDFSNAELGLDGYAIFRCDRNTNTSVNQRVYLLGGALIAVKNELHPVLITSPYVDIEQVFIIISILSGSTCLLASVYLPLTF